MFLRSSGGAFLSAGTATDLSDGVVCGIGGGATRPGVSAAGLGVVCAFAAKVAANATTTRRSEDFIKVPPYQTFTRSLAVRTMGDPSGILNAFWNSSKFESGIIVRNRPGECGS